MRWAAQRCVGLPVPCLTTVRNAGGVVLLDHNTVSSGLGQTSAMPGPRAPSGDPVLRRADADWVRRYAWSLIGWETVAAALAGGSVLLARLDSLSISGSLLWAVAVVTVAWPVALGAAGAYDERVFGTGSDEYRQVGRAGFALLALAGFLSYAFDLDLSRAFVVVAVPSLTLVTLGGRYAARNRLRRLR